MRAPYRSMLFVAALAGAALPSRAQGSWNEGFNLAGFDGPVRAIASFDAGAGAEVFAAGDFLGVGVIGANRIARFDGTNWVEPVGGFDGPVAALVVFDDGTGPALYAAGSFSRAGTITANGVARWNGSAWSALGAGFAEDVHALVVFDDGTGAKLHAGGAFAFSAGQPIARVAKWNGTAWSALGAGLDGPVRALTVFDEGAGPRLFAAGSFANAGGATAANLARWDGANWSALAVAPGAPVHALSVFGGRLVAGGEFTNVGNRVASWDGASWSTLGLGVDAPVQALVVHDDGAGPDLYVGGDFALAGGASAAAVARWDGAQWSSLIAGAVGPSVRALASHGTAPAALLCVGGSFSPATAAGHRRFAVWNGVAWSALGTNQGLSSAIWGAGVHDDGSGPALYVGGDFSQIGGVQVNYIARWNGTSWSSVGGGIGNRIYSMCTFDDGLGQGPCLYVTGVLTTAGGQPANRIARWNGTSWSALGSGLDDWGRAVQVYDDGTGPALYVLGEFQNAGGVPASRIARWNGTSWSALGSGLNLTFGGELAVFDDGTGSALYAGGSFTTAGGIPAVRIARWNGTTWSALDNGLNGQVDALAVHDDGTGASLYVGGTFTSANGVILDHVARWDGVTWQPLGSGFDVGVGGRVFSLRSFDDGSGPALYAGGQFTFAGGQPAVGIARWNGTTWSALGAGVPGGLVYGTAVYDSGRGRGPGLFIGGFLSPVNGVESDQIAEWRGASVQSFCAGDGTLATSCPCANFGAVGRGCGWNGNPSGARLEARGRIQPDELVPRASGMPASAGSTIFLKGDAEDLAGSVFGDGVRCVSGALIRLGIKTNVNGAAEFPEPGNQSISFRGGTPPSSGLLATYQTYYRSASPSFCTPSTFNITNGLRILW